MRLRSLLIGNMSDPIAGCLRLLPFCSGRVFTLLVHPGR